jgi:Na+/H+ antiporter NhaD/arsenite permease-like protein
MEAIVIILFVVGYLAIALEHPIKINKTASALLTGVICWTIYAVTSSPDHIEEIGHHLGEHLGEIAAILFFLMGAMTIVELVDAYQGFKIITDRINTKKSKETDCGLFAV